MKRLLLVLGLVLVSLPAFAQDGWTPAPRRTGAHFSIGRNYTLPRGETATGTVLVIGGSASVDGHVEDDVVVIGGNLRVGATAEIDGDATAMGGHVTMDPMARVHGDINKVGIDWPVWNPGGGLWRVLAMSWMGMRLVVTLLLSILLTLIFPRSIGDVACRVESAPGASFAVGFLAQILVAPAVVILVIALVITVVGIPLLAAVPILLVLFGGVWIAGFAAASATMGASLRGVVARPGFDPRVGDVLTGFLLLTGCTIAGQVMMLGPWMGAMGGAVRVFGACIEYLAWTIGLGAALTSLMAKRRGGLPPSLPPPLPTPAA